MIRNYLKGIGRYVARNKAFTAINIMGLVIGMTACMLIMQFVLHEFSYDNFHAHKENIFRVQQDRYDKGELSTRWASGCAGIGLDLKTNFPEVERYVRLSRQSPVLSKGDVLFKEENIFFSSEDFFKVFTVPLLSGVDSTALNEPFKIVLSQTMAKKYFGDEDAIGKTLKYDGGQDFEVTGVFKDLPDNTHMKIDALASFKSLQKWWNGPIDSWQWDGFMTYVQLKEKTDYKALEKKFPAFIEKLKGAELKKYDAGMAFHLQPITDIHLDSDFMMEFKPNGDRQSVYFLLIVAVLILVIAWINYVNLSSAKSIERAREVGVRKVMGGFRTQLIQQFLLESILFNTVAVVMAIVFVIFLTPWFSALTERQLDYLLFKESMFWLWIGILIVGGALLSGIYPAFVLSGYKPVDVLKGRFKNNGQGVYFRKGMVIAQFVASITLIVGTFTVYEQIQYMRHQKLGVDLDQTLVVNAPNVVDSTYRSKFQVFRNLVKQYPEVMSVSASTSVPGRQPNWNAGGIRRLSQREDESKQYRVIMMDHEFIKLYGLEVIAGRPFSAAVANENHNILINESASRQIGYKHIEDALDDRIFFWGDTFRIVGVLKDYHQESLKKAFEPLLFRYSEASQGFHAIKFNTAKVQASIAKFEADWKSIFPGNPFISFFLDDHYNQQYKSDQQFGKVFGIFSALAIFIACLGLFGLSSLTVIQRTKEIGVRKVLGASVTSIVSLVSKDYILLMLASIVVAIPASMWVMDSWLQHFANRITLSWWIFALPSFMVIFIALATVSIHTLKAAGMNPTKSLRYE